VAEVAHDDDAALVANGRLRYSEQRAMADEWKQSVNKR
jgi:hypothetical protein